MMNKKGSIKRFLLYVLLFSVLVFVIYSLILTFKEINNKNKTKVNNKSSLRMLDDNTTFNVYDYIYNYGIIGVKLTNLANNDSNVNYSTNLLNFESNSLVYVFGSDVNGVSNFYNNNNLISPQYSQPTIYDFNGDSRLSLSADVALNNYSSSPTMTRYQLFNSSSYGGSLGTYRSFALFYNCDIPLEYFNFDFVYNLPLSTTNEYFIFYVLTDNGGYCSKIIKVNSNSISYSFNSSSIIASLPTATKVTRFGFAIAQTQNSTGADYYLPQNLSGNSATTGFNYVDSTSYTTYFINVKNTQSLNSALNLFYLDFVESPLNPYYVEGYNTGYNDGINYNQNSVNVLNSQINTLNSEISDLRSTINTQTAIITQLQEQLNQSQSNFKDLFFTFTDIPIKTIHDVLNFEFFGMNLFRFFTGVLTALGTIWLIKKFL